MGKIRYKEIQKFKQIWIWVILIGINGLFFWSVIQQMVFGMPMGNNPAPDYILILISIIPIGLLFLFLYTKLEITITESGIEYQFVPFQLKKHKIDWDNIELAEVKEYNPIKEYGGWGIKYGKKGKAFNVSGKIGLELKFKDKKKTVLFGTQKPNELKRVIKQLVEKGIIKTTSADYDKT